MFQQKLKTKQRRALVAARALAEVKERAWQEVEEEEEAVGREEEAGKGRIWRRLGVCRRQARAL